ncbi:hypothetical protein MKW92_006680 [Papaver armeniacum]|nr:hypothetical protein MKW92_006680 [Papaver armeniacum]
MWKQIQNKFSSEEDSRLNNLNETFTSFCRTPLHIAVMSGDVEFAAKILSKEPDLALKEDTQGMTPLHLASTRTSLRMVRLLLKDKPGACTVQDQDGRTPLHIASMKNRVEIMKVLMEEGLPEAIHLRNDQNGETILHFCIKCNTNLKTIKLLAEYLVPAQPPYPNSISINSKDNDDNTILHLAAKMGNMKIINYLLLKSNVRIDINVINKTGLRALNMLSQAERNNLEFGYHVCDEHHKSKTLSKKGDSEGLKERVNVLMVVATLIAGIAFQAVMNPPGGVWQDDSKVDSGTDPVTFAYYLQHMFGSSISGGLDRYIFKYRLYSGGATYSYITNFTRSMMAMEEYTIMKGLILEDFAFTDFVSYYRNKSSDNSTRVGFFPYLIRYAGYPILAYTYPTNYVVYMITSVVAFFVSLTIIFLVIWGFMIETSLTQVRILVGLMCISIGCIASGYLSILVAMVPAFYIGGFCVYLILQVFLGVCCILAVGLFIWTSVSVLKIVKLQKRTGYHHMGVGYYVKALFFSMGANAAGKLVLFILGYCAFRLMGYFYHGKWFQINPFLF